MTVNLAVLLVGLLLVELAFGNWLRPNRMNRLHILRDVELHFTVKGLYPSPTGISSYRRDRYGFRGTYSSPGEIDILTVGGSTTDQRLLSEGETWQDALAAEFLREGKRVSVVNGGVVGQSTYGHIKNFDWWYPEVPGLEVAYFLFYVGINDFYKDAGYHYDRVLRPAGLGSAIEANSIVYHAFSTLRGLREAYYLAQRGRQRFEFDALPWTTTARLDDYDDLMLDRLEAYRQRLEILGQKARDLGSGVICVSQPSRRYRVTGDRVEGIDEAAVYDGVEYNGVDFYHMMRRLNRLTLETCRKMGGIAIDLARELDLEDADFYDYYHNTPQGSAKIGLYLHRRLRHLFEQPDDLDGKKRAGSSEPARLPRREGEEGETAQAGLHSRRRAGRRSRAHRG